MRSTRHRPGGAAHLPVRHRGLRPWLVAGIALLLAGCSSTTRLAGRAIPVRAAPTTTSSSSTEPPTTTTTTAPEEPGWSTLSTGPHGIAVDERVYPQSDGAQVVVVRFLRGHVNYSLHIGSQDPPTGGAVIGPQSGPAVSAAEQPLLLACFNGGFKATAGVGGTTSGGTALVPLRAGTASLVLDTTGAAQLGVWGSTVPTPGEQVASVRQNLPPLVLNGRPTADVGTWQDWGATLGGGPTVARSALGQDAAGNLLFAGSMHAVPLDLATALVSAGAATAMELDINPGQVQVDTAATPGAPLAAQIPGQIRPADQCQAGWTRDFITVLSVG
jgi:hypothetical protein